MHNDARYQKALELTQKAETKEQAGPSTSRGRGRRRGRGRGYGYIKALKVIRLIASLVIKRLVSHQPQFRLMGFLKYNLNLNNMLSLIP